MKKLKMPWGAILLLASAMLSLKLILGLYKNAPWFIWILLFIFWLFIFYFYFRKIKAKSRSTNHAESKEFEQFNLEKYFRDRNFWFGLIFLSWVASFIWLGPGSIFIHLVAISWAIGFVYFFPADLRSETMVGITEIISIVGLILFVIFLIRIKKIPHRSLYIFSIIFLLVLMLALVGCSQISSYDNLVF